MDRQTLTRRIMAGLAAATLLTGCDAGATVAPSVSPANAPSMTAVPATPAAVPSPGSAVHWNLVSISDSVFGSGDENHLEAVDDYAAGIKQDLGVDVTVHGYWLGGYTSDQVLELIQSDDVLRAAL